jgi:hypothetical protein
VSSGVEGFFDDVLHDALNAYTNYRAESKRKLTPSGYDAAKQRLQELKALGHEPKDVVMQTIRNGWQDLYELKHKKEKKETTVERAKRVFSII